MALAEGWTVGKELVKLGLVPETCCELRITCNTNDVIVMETKSYVTQEWWDKFVTVALAAKERGKVLACHTTVNVETGEVAES